MNKKAWEEGKGDKASERKSRERKSPTKSFRSYTL